MNDRARWKAVKLHKSGKLTVADWRQYEIFFKSLWVDVPDATENEAYELLISSMPANFRTNIFDAESSRYGNKTVLKIAHMGDYTADQARGNLLDQMG